MYSSAETIYDLDGWFVTASAYFGIGATWSLLDNGEMVSLSGIGVGGDLSGGYSFLIPTSDINTWLLKDYLIGLGFTKEEAEEIVNKIKGLIKEKIWSKCR